MSFVKNLFSSPSQPATPNPNAIAAAQGAANEGVARLTAKLNRTDTYSPTGSVIFEDLGDDRWQTTQTLSPEAQGIFDTQLQTGQTVADAAQRQAGYLPNDKFSLSGTPGYQGAIDLGGLAALPTDMEGARKSASDAVYGRLSNRLDDRFGREQDLLDSQLATQGITQGSDAYNDAYKQFGQIKNDAYLSASQEAVGAGQNELSNLLSNSLLSRQQGLAERSTLRGMDNEARQQGIQDQLLERTQPLNELAALLQGAPAINGPQPIQQTPVGVAPPDVVGANALSAGVAQNNFAQRQGATNAALGGLSSLGSAAILASDVRLKRDIRKVYEAPELGGLGIYVYRYLGEKTYGFGVMAQEVLRKMPEAVVDRGGLLLVDYRVILGRLGYV